MSVVPVRPASGELPVITLDAVKRAVGGGALVRGRQYAAQGRVARLAWDHELSMLQGRVKGSRGAVYTTSVWLAPDRSGVLQVDDTSCTCPVGIACKHAAACLFTYQEQRARRATDAATAAPAPQVPAWRRAMQTLTSQLPQPQTTDVPVVPLGLQVRIEGVSKNRVPDPKRVSVSVRPVVRPVTAWKSDPLASWVPADPRYSYRQPSTRLDPEHRRWLTALGQVWHAEQTTYYYGYYSSSSWRPLDGFAPTVLWPMLAEASALGIPLVGPAARDTVTLAGRAELALDIRQTDDGVLHVGRRVAFDGQTSGWDVAGVVGNHGLFAATLGTSGQVVHLGPVDPPLRDGDALVLTFNDVTVAPGEVPEFMADFYPTAAHSLTVISSDRSADLPAPPRPVLTAVVAYTSPREVYVWWDWDYQGQRVPVDGAGRDGTGHDRTGHSTAGPGPSSANRPDMWREHGTEREIARTVTEAVRAVPGFDTFGLAGRTELLGLRAVDFAEQVVPVLQALDDVQVEHGPDQPDYRELVADPVVTVATTATDDNDWFDLGVTVTVDDRDMPFAPLFTALARGEDRLLLDDGAWLSLYRPQLDRLRLLIEEARSLTDRGPLRINRYQASLWDEFEELADVVEQADEWRESVAALVELTRTGTTPAPVQPPDGFTADLRAYQQHGLDWLAFLWTHRLGGVLADDMGLGKTIQALALMAHVQATEPRPAHPGSAGPEPGADDRGPFLVVAPASVVGNWAAEAARFAPRLKVHVQAQTTAKAGVDLAQVWASCDVVVTSYAIFRLDFERFHELRWAGLVLDEAQFAKNPKTKANTHARALRARIKLAVTGTPMENGLGELWAVLAIVAPGLFPSASRFRETYTTPITDGGKARKALAAAPPALGDELRQDMTSRAAAGDARLARLRTRMRPIVLRRTKELVAPELPERQEQVLEVDLAPKHRHLYDAFLQRERQRLLALLDDYDGNRFTIFRSLTLLRRMALDASLVDDKYAGTPCAKLDALFDQLDEVVSGGHRALVFSQFTTFLRKVAQRCDAQDVPYEYLDGSTTRRPEVIARFKDGTAPLFLISLKAGGFGLNLTEADYVFLLDPWWNPATENQAVDRTHRVGQTRPVLVQRLVSRGTIEEKVMALKARKAELFAAVLADDDAAFSASLTADDVRGLLDPP